MNSVLEDKAKGMEGEFTVPLRKAAEVVGLSQSGLRRKARVKGEVAYRLRGLGARLRMYFHPDDVERLRQAYQIGYMP